MQTLALCGSIVQELMVKQPLRHAYAYLSKHTNIQDERKGSKDSVAVILAKVSYQFNGEEVSKMKRVRNPIDVSKTVPMNFSPYSSLSKSILFNKTIVDFSAE